MENTYEYIVEVEVKKNPIKSDEINTIVYTVKAKSEWQARMKASDLCAEQFGHNPYYTEVIDWELI